MALTPQNNEAFLREVDEELRRDEVTRFWKRWGIWVGAAVVLALAAFAAWLIWTQRQAAGAGREAAALSQAIEQLGASQPGPARATLDPITTSDHPGYRAAARLALADAALQAGDQTAAAEGYQAVAADGAIGQPLRDLALIRATAADYDRLPPATVVQRLSRLAVPGNPWFGSAGELVALAQARLGRQQEAARLFRAIANDAAVPASIRSRAVQFAGLVETGAPAPSPGPAAPTAQEAN